MVLHLTEGFLSHIKFLNLLNLPGVTYLAPNVCRTPGSYVYFMADVPYLFKTIRNTWHNSQLGRSRYLMVRFKHLMVIMVAIIRTMDVKSNGHIWLSWQRLVLQIQGYI